VPSGREGARRPPLVFCEKKKKSGGEPLHSKRKFVKGKRGKKGGRGRLPGGGKKKEQGPLSLTGVQEGKRGAFFLKKEKSKANAAPNARGATSGRGKHARCGGKEGNFAIGALISLLPPRPRKGGGRGPHPLEREKGGNPPGQAAAIVRKGKKKRKRASGGERKGGKPKNRVSPGGEKKKGKKGEHGPSFMRKKEGGGGA